MIEFHGAVTEDDLLGAAYDALSAGAFAVITARGTGQCRRLAAGDLPVMGNLGFVPKKSTMLGDVRALGTSADDAVR